MNISNIDKRSVAYGSFLEICCRKCGEIPQFVIKYSDDGTSWDNTIPDDWHVEVDTNEKTNIKCYLSKMFKIFKIR